MSEHKDVITDHLDQIASLFSGRVKITIIIRSDDMLDGKDIIISNDDDLDQVAGAIMRCGNAGLQ